MFVLLAMYTPFFFVFFLSNSLRVNVAMRFADEPEWRSLLRAGIANSLGLMLIQAIQYTTFFATGTVYWTDGWLYVNLLFAVVPIMFILPYYHRIFFRMTGRVYLGPMVMCLIFVMILLSNTVCYIPPKVNPHVQPPSLRRAARRPDRPIPEPIQQLVIADEKVARTQAAAIRQPQVRGRQAGHPSW